MRKQPHHGTSNVRRPRQNRTARRHFRAVFPLALDHVVVAVAHARGTDSNLHFACARRFDLHILQVQGSCLVVQYGCLHARSSIPRGKMICIVPHIERNHQNRSADHQRRVSAELPLRLNE